MSLDRVKTVGAVVSAFAGLALACTRDATGPAASEPVARVVVQPEALTVYVGTDVRLRAVALSASGDTLRDRPFAWTSSAPAVAAVGDSGTVIGLAVGTAVVTATAASKADTALVYVSDVPVARVTIAPSQESLTVAGTAQLKAAALDSAGDTLAGRVLRWVTTNPAVATVSGSGLVTAVGVGNDTVSATVEGQAALARISVAAPPDLSGVWDWTESFTGPPGAAACTDTGSYTFALNGASLTGLSEQVGQCTSSGGVTSNDQSGPVLGGMVSGSTITFMVGDTLCRYTGTLSGTPPSQISGTSVCFGATGTWQAVRNLPVGTVTVTPDSVLLVPGGSRLFAAALFASTGQRVFGRDVSWATGDPSIATATKDTTLMRAALATALAAGATSVTATYGGTQGKASLAVEAVSYGAVSAGGAGSCGLDASGLAFCWGDVGGLAPTVVGGTRFASVVVGDGHACALTAAGAASCWGVNGYSDLGNMTFSSLSAGGSQECDYYGCYDVGHTCGISTAGGAFCWGNNDYSQLGNGTSSSTAQPVPVSGPVLVAVAAGGFHSCGLTAAGAAYCWGLNSSGQLGDSTVDYGSATPVRVAGGHTFASIAASDDHTCALTPSGQAWCWGYDGNGALGDSTTSTTGVPVAVAGGLTFTSVVTGNGFSCGLATGGAVSCWGQAPWMPQASLVPAALSGGLTFLSISTGSAASHLCGRASDGIAYCVGWNGDGQLGDGTTNTRTTPVRVMGQP